MKVSEYAHRKREFTAKLLIWMAGRGSRNRSPLDKFCRFVVDRSTQVAPEEDFMRDPIIDNDQGFDPEELIRYQRNE